MNFIEQLYDSSHIWKFNIIHGLKIEGRVVDYRISSKAIPITVTVQQSDDVTPVEIPWTSIQYITHLK